MTRLNRLAAVLAIAVAPVAMAQDVGVPACDNFLRSYAACVPNMPEPVRPSVTQSIEQMRAAWRTAAGNPGGREALAQQCPTMAQQVAQQMAQFNCRF
jgi:hypothetical protein